jgi:hypothetical protein
MKNTIFCLLFVLILILSQACAHASAGASFYNLGQGHIFGCAWQDENGNGLRDPGELGIKGTEIYLNNDQTAITDQYGQYNFTNLPPNQYTITDRLDTGWIHTYPTVVNDQDQAHAWTALLGQQPNSYVECVIVKTDPLGNVYFVGIFDGLADFNPSVGHDMRQGAATGFITRLNTDGSYAWTTLFGHSLQKNALDMVIDASGNLIIGYEHSILKLTSDGQLSGLQTFQVQSQGHLGITALCLDPTQNLIVTGSFSGTVDFNPGADVNLLSTSQGIISSLFLTKIDANDAYVWTRISEKHPSQSGAMSVPHAVCSDSAGQIYLAGAFRRFVDFDPGIDTDYRSSMGDWDIFLSKYDSDGTYAWTKAMGAPDYDLAYDVCTDTEDNVLIAGTYSLMVPFGDSPETTLDTKHVKIGAGFVAKYTRDADCLWVADLGERQHYTAATSLAVSPSGNIFVAAERMPLDAYAESSSDLVVIQLAGDTPTRISQKEFPGIIRTTNTWRENDFEFPHYPWNWGLAVTPQGDLLIAGQVDNTLVTSDAEVHVARGIQEAFVCKYAATKQAKGHTIILQAGQAFFGVDFGTRFMGR